MTAFILDLIARGGYLGIFVLMALENVLPPIPSEVIMGLGGMAVARGDMAIVPLVAWGTAGTTLGNLVWYGLGRWIGLDRLQPFVRRHGRWLTLTWQDVERLHAFFERHGGWVVFVFRFLPTFRTMISLPAGMARMGLVRFLVWTFAGAAIWNSVLAGAGYYLGANYEALQHYVGPLAVAITAAILLGYGWRILTWRPRT